MNVFVARFSLSPTNAFSRRMYCECVLFSLNSVFLNFIVPLALTFNHNPPNQVHLSNCKVQSEPNFSGPPLDSFLGPITGISVVTAYCAGRECDDYP